MGGDHFLLAHFRIEVGRRWPRKAALAHASSQRQSPNRLATVKTAFRLQTAGSAISKLQPTSASEPARKGT